MLGFEVLSLFVWPRCLLSFFELGRWASLTIFPSLSPISCAILPQSSPALNFATMPSNLWPEALASKFAISNSPYPSSVDDFSVRSVATGTPVSLDILFKTPASPVASEWVMSCALLPLAFPFPLSVSITRSGGPAGPSLAASLALASSSAISPGS